MKYFKKLVGDRMYLSPRNPEDVEKYVNWLNDFQITDYTGRSNKLLTIEAERDYFKNNTNAESAFAMVDLKDDTMFGNVGLENIDHVNRTGTLGIFIGDENYRDNGYGTEAIRLVLEYGFKYLNLYNIKLDVMSFNDRAISCYKKCGFKECGRRRKCKFINGKYYDSIEMDILADEFDGDFIRNKNI